MSFGEHRRGKDVLIFDTAKHTHNFVPLLSVVNALDYLSRSSRPCVATIGLQKDLGILTARYFLFLSQHFCLWEKLLNLRTF